MTDTSYALQTIGASEFETVVTYFLRRRDSQLAGLITTGVNEEGKPIPCPVDGILYIPGDQPRCVAVASTTMSRQKLRGKWLGTKDDKGDIKKAEEEFQEWRESEPGIECTLCLATNRPLESDVSLYRDAVQTGHANGVAVEIVEASQLVDFLDHEPEGQYLREELLGIEANRLSESLLRKIAYLSLSYHRCRFAIGRSYQEKEIIRDVHSQLVTTLEESTTPFVGLRGVSGTGKSTLLRQVGKEINAKEGIALWVPAEDIESGISIDCLLLRVLQRFRSSLSPRAGEDAVRLASSLPGGLVLLVDDVNRLPVPEQALSAIHAWDAPISDEETSSLYSGRSWLRFVVPLWPRQPAISSSLTSQKDSKWKYVELQPYSPSERATLAAVLSESHPEGARWVVDALNGDPFLCGLASADLVVPVGISYSNLVRKIFDEALNAATREAAQSRRIEATPSEFAAAVSGLIELMVQDEEPEPKWSQVRAVLGDHRTNLLHILSDTNQLGWIELRDDQEIWRWKHERLRDAFVGRWLANNVLPQIIAGDTSNQVRAWLSDPGLVEDWALALIFLPSMDAQTMALTLLAEHQPLILAEVLRINLFPVEEKLRQIIAKGLVQTLANFDERTREFVGSPQRWIIEKLSQTDDPLVLKITQGLHPSWGIWAARLRNGSVWAGLEWISQILARRDFLPGVRFSLLELSIQALASLYDRQRDYVESELTQAIGQIELSAAALTLAGYLAWPELAHPIWGTWNLLSDADKLETLVPIVWALSRCGDETTQSGLEEALLLVRETSDEKKIEGRAHHASDRYWQFMEPLWQTLRRWPITFSSAETWAKVAIEYPDLSQTMCYILRGIDHPATMEAYVRWSAEKGGTLWDDAAEPFGPLVQLEHMSRIPLNSVTRDHLWDIFVAEADETVRRIAFNFWKRSVKISDLVRLRDVPSSDPLFERVLQVRVNLRDRTAAELLIGRMQSEPGLWCGYAPLLYDEPGVAKALLDNLDAAFDGQFWRPYAIAQHLPIDDVRDLVREKRDLLLRLPRTWLALWCSEVPEALALVQEAVAQANPDDLEFFFSWSGFPFPVSHRMLDTLVPVLGCFPVDEQKRLAELAVRGGFTEWVQDHLLDVALGSHFWMTEEDVISILAAAAEMVPKGLDAVLRNTEVFSLKFRLEDGRGGLATNITEILQTWLGSAPDDNRLTIAAILLGDFGTSNDISWWQSMEPAGESIYTAWSNALYILKRRRWHS